jgi:hypothetical protein
MVIHPCFLSPTVEGLREWYDKVDCGARAHQENESVAGNGEVGSRYALVTYMINYYSSSFYLLCGTVSPFGREVQRD